MAQKTIKKLNMKLSVPLAANWHNLDIDQVLGPISNKDINGN